MADYLLESLQRRAGDGQINVQDAHLSAASLFKRNLLTAVRAFTRRILIAHALTSYA